MKTLQDYIDKLNSLNFKEMYNNDFFWTWDKTDDELEAVFTVADALRFMREHNISTKVFESGLGISIFRDNSTRTRFSFASACNLLGLEVQDLDEKKSQIAHGETVRETANMVSFMADVIGIRDDMYIGKGHTYQKEFMDAVTEGNKDGILKQRTCLSAKDADKVLCCMFVKETKNMEGMKVEQIFVLAFLGINSWKDIRKREVSLLATGIFAVIGIINALWHGTIFWEWIGAVGFGTALIALSVVSKGAVGMGDGLVLAALGTVLTFGELLGVFMMGLLCCSVWGIILLILPRTGRKTEIPFVPFLLLGYIGGLIY